MNSLFQSSKSGLFFLKPPGALSIKPWGRGGGFSLPDTFFNFFFPRNTSFLWCFGVSVKQFTECEKQILDCESRFRAAKGGFWSAKTGFGVRKRFLSQAGEFFLPALRAGEFFLPEIRAGNFFAKSSCPPPPPIKIKWLLPYGIICNYTRRKSFELQQPIEEGGIATV